MRRSASILLAIFVGALATGLGGYFFLRQANADRVRLAELAQKTQQEAQAAQDESKKAVEEANKKMDDASAEVAKAQQAIKALQEERDLLARATPLALPDAKTLKGWKDVIDLPLGVSCKAPPFAIVETNDERSLTLAKDTGRWFSVTPYEERLENELLNSVVTSTSVSYVVDGHLFAGWIGHALDRKQDMYILRIRKDGQNTHLVWMRTPEGALGTQTLLTTLASLSFQK